MGSKTFSNEEVNFLKFASIVLGEFPKTLREIFVHLWDNRIAPLPGYLRWDDSIAVRNMLLAAEGGYTVIPTNKSFEQWDCTKLFKATIYAKSFALPDGTGKKKTLHEIYLKTISLAPGSFHPSVSSPSGDANESLALAIDQIRLLRNTICHAEKLELDTATFGHYVQLAKDAFTSANVNTVGIDYIAGLSESDFPTAKRYEMRERVLEERIKELQDNNQFLQHGIGHEICGINERTQIIEEFAKTSYEELRKCTNLIHVTQKQNEKSDKDVENISDIQSHFPKSFLPTLNPYFTGRVSECKNVIDTLTSGSTRFLNIWGTAGFGKSETAIAASHDLESQGHSVSFFKCRGMKSSNDFYSRLLSYFRPLTSSTVFVGLTPMDELCCIFRVLSCRIFLVVDDIDELLVCGKSCVDGKPCSNDENVMIFIDEILNQCENTNFLAISRTSLDFMKLRMEGYQSIRIGPLDKNSAETLTRNLLPSATDEDLEKIADLCGNVPQAIRLLCFSGSIDNNNVTSSLVRVIESTEGFQNILDNPDYSSDLRLMSHFESSFNQLSMKEKEAFVSLSSFNGRDFNTSAAATVIGGNAIGAEQTLIGLVNKALVDTVDSRTETQFSLHSLLQSFATNKGDEQFKEVVLSSKSRFYDYYLHLFAQLNKAFLTGRAKMAFDKFYREEQNIWMSFREGFQQRELFKKLFDALTTAELFLNALYISEQENIGVLYDLASKKAQQEDDVVNYCRLAVSRCFRRTYDLYNKNETLVPGNIETQEKVYCSPGRSAPKCMCYQGIYLLLRGKSERGTELMEKGISDLGNSPDQVIVKIFTSQLLSFHYKFSNNLEKSSQFGKYCLDACVEIGNSGFSLFSELETETAVVRPGSHDSVTLSNLPFILWISSLLTIWTREYLSAESKVELRRLVLEILEEQVDVMSGSWDKTLATLFYTGDLALFFLRTDEGAPADESLMKLNSNTTCRDQVNDRERLATHYFRLGLHYRMKGQLARALQSHKCALEIRQELYGERHVKTADSYHAMGNILSNMGNVSGALESHERALDIRLELYGKQHAKTADSYRSVGIVQCKMEKYVTALQSHRLALEIRSKVHGENDSKTANSHISVGATEESMGNHISAVQSYEHALAIRRELYGEKHGMTAECYELIGNALDQMKDYTAALKSYHRALDIRLQVHGDEHASIAFCYHNIAVVQYNIGECASALHLLEDAVSIIKSNLRARKYGKALASHLHFNTPGDVVDNSSDVQSKHFQGAEIEFYSNNLADAYHNIGIIQSELGKNTPALLSHQRALDMSRKLHGERHANVADNYHCLAIVQSNERDYALALDSHQRALAINIELHGKRSAQAADSLRSLASTQNKMGDYCSAVSSLQRVLDIRQELHGEHDATIADCYNNIGVVQSNMEDYLSALESKQKALDITIELYGEDSARTADCYQSIGSTHNSMEDFTSALQSYQQVLNIRQKLHGTKHRAIAECYYYIGVVHRNQGEYVSALQSHQLELEVRLEIFGEIHSKTANSYQNLGSAQDRLGQRKEAIRSLRRALNIRRELFGEQHPLVADSYRHIGIVQRNNRDFKSALQSFRNAYDISSKILGINDKKTAEIYHDLQKAKSGLQKDKDRDCAII